MVLEISLLIVSSMCLCAALILHSLPSGILQGTILGQLFCSSHIFLFVSFFLFFSFLFFYLIYLYSFVLLKVVGFFMYDNVMSSNISSSLKMYADNTKVYREPSNLETNTRTLQFDINPLNGEVTLWINSGVYIWKMENNILLYNGTGTKVCQTCKRSWRRDLSDLSYTLTM